MINDKRMFYLVTKYHSAIVGRLIKRGLACKNENCIEVAKSTSRDAEYIDLSKCCTDYKGFKILTYRNSELIYDGYNGRFVNFKNIFAFECPILSGCMWDVRDDLRRLIPEMPQELNLYRSNEDDDPDFIYCEISNFEIIIKNLNLKLTQMYLPKGFRVKKELRQYYIEMMKFRFNQWAKGKFLYSRYYFKNNFYDAAQSNLAQKRGIFGFDAIYKEMEWTFDFVEENKEHINWSFLLHLSDLKWNEDYIQKYEQNILNKDTGKYLFKDYSVFGNLSYDFIEKHKHKLSWYEFLSTGIFKLTSKQLATLGSYTNGQISGITKNKHFEWTPLLLKTAIEIDKDILKDCIENKRLNSKLQQIPNYKEFVNRQNLDEEDFWLKFQDGGAIQNRAYSAFFYEDNIKKNQKEWEEIILEYRYCIYRRPDTNEHRYKAVTMWDRFKENKAVKLTYSLCKVLYPLTIRLGGTFVKEDDIYLSEDNRHPEHNALEVFSDHDFQNEEEIKKVLEDNDLMDFFMSDKSHKNNDMLDFLIDNFFADFSIEEYLQIVNKMSDSDLII